jgi:hypothetical protein
MTEKKSREELEVDLESAYTLLRDKREQITELQDKLLAAEQRVEEEQRRCRGITSTYCGMRTRLDMAFGAPDDANGNDRNAAGRAAGLEGAVNWAIAEYGRVTRLDHQAD